MTKDIKILLVGVTYSENRGDGVIADCMEWVVRRALPQAEVNHLDLAGRMAQGTKAVPHRALILKAIAFLPGIVRKRLVAAGLKRLLDRLRPQWTKAIADADHVIISGGQVFSDVDLNFPFKIGKVAEICAEQSVPVAIAAAGVAGNWSSTGTMLFKKLTTCELTFVGLRDQSSLSHWAAQFGSESPHTVLVRDPGFLAAGCYDITPASGTDLPVGIGITSPLSLTHHSDDQIAGAGDPVSYKALFRFFRDTALAAVGRDHRVCLFCNGAAEDGAMLHALSLDPQIADMVIAGRVIIAPVPQSGGALAQTIAGCKAVIGHRLHACIVGYAFQRPVVGLSWDSKLESFLTSVGLSDNILKQPNLLPEDAVTAVEEALQSGVNPLRHAEILEECEAGLSAVLATSPTQGAGLDV